MSLTDVALEPKQLRDALRDAREAPEVRAELLLSHRDHAEWATFRRAAEVAPAEVIAIVLERFRAEPESKLATYFIAALAHSFNLEEDWKRAVRGLVSLDTFYATRGSKVRRAKIAELARSPLLQAVQAAVGRPKGPYLDMLAVLAADGSEASVDALLPVLHRAMSEKGPGLDQLAALRVHAAQTAPMRQFLELVDRAILERNESSPALDFADRNGFGKAKRFSAHWVIRGDRLGATGEPLHQAQIAIASTKAEWLQVLVAEVPGWPHPPRRTEFSEGVRPVFHDVLGIGRCSADELPRWLAELGARFGERWTVREASVRGRKQAQLISWLLSATEPT